MGAFKGLFGRNFENRTILFLLAARQQNKSFSIHTGKKQNKKKTKELISDTAVFMITNKPVAFRPASIVPVLDVFQLYTLPFLSTVLWALRV